MSRLRPFLGFAFACAILGCGGSGGGGTPSVTNATFQVVWPQRSRTALPSGLSSALSVSVDFTGAGAGGSDVVVNIDRDTTKVAGYTGTYTVAQAIRPGKLKTMTATFYAQAAEQGANVGTAYANSAITGENIALTSIVVDGVIKSVTVPATSLTLGGGTTQLSFSALNASGQVVAVSAGSAIWSVTSGGTYLTLTPDGIATPVSAGKAQVTATIDGVASSGAAISVGPPPSEPIYTFPSGKGGELISPGFDAVEGESFQVTGGSSITVTALGFENDTQIQNQPSMAALFDSNGNILASATISTSDALSSGYYWATITPITLQSGQQYYIGGLHGTGSTCQYIFDTRTAAVPSFIDDLGTYFKVSTTLAGGSWSYGGGTSQYGSGEARHYIANFQVQTP